MTIHQPQAALDPLIPEDPGCASRRGLSYSRKLPDGQPPYAPTQKCSSPNFAKDAYINVALATNTPSSSSPPSLLSGSGYQNRVYF